MLSPVLSNADRQFTRSINVAYNQVLQDLVAEFEATDSHHHYAYTDIIFDTPFIASEVSPIDCFHPSAQGQRRVSDLTWDTGPFAAFQR
jgi:hypothetical protein